MRRPIYLSFAASEQIDRTLPTEPTGDGRPTITEFLKLDLERELELLADEFDELPETVLPDGSTGRLHYANDAATVAWFHLGANIGANGAIVVNFVGIWPHGTDDQDPFENS